MGIFDEMAARYDRPERVEVAGWIADALRPRLAGDKARRAIDYGCGTGLVGLQLADCFESLLLVDASQNMIERVKEKVAALGLSNADTLCADFSQEIPSGLSVDVILMAQVLLHIPDTEGILRQLYKLLNPGGHLLIVDFDKNEAVASDKVHNGFVQAELISLMERIGYAEAESRTFYHGSNLFMNKDASMFLLDAYRGR